MTDARRIVEGLTCSRGACACAATSRAGRGKTHCPAHDDANPSLNVDPPAKPGGDPIVHCFANCDQTDVIGALRERGLWPMPRLTHHPAAAPVVTRYPYVAWQQLHGSWETVAYHVRTDRQGYPKRMSWQMANGHSGLGGRHIKDLPLYRLPYLAPTARTKPVILVEGEACADAVAALGYLGVTLAGGAGQTDFGEALLPLTGRVVYLWPDNDVPGRGLMRRVGTALQHIAASVLWLEPGFWEGSRLALAPRWDVVDWIRAGGTAEDLQRWMDQASENEDSDADEAYPVEAPQETVEQAVTMAMADVERVALRWLWPGRMPVGKFVLLDGDPAIGKSLITLDLAARLSQGWTMPDGAYSDLEGPRSVLLLCAEDDAGDTLRPRLEAAGADLSRIHILNGVREADGSVVDADLANIDQLEEAIRRTGAALVVIDPVAAYIPARVDSHRDADIRRVLRPLSELAARTGATILGVRHLNKSAGGSSLYRGGMSIAFIAASRLALVVGMDPTDEMGIRRILAVNKSNLAVKAPSLTYEVREKECVPVVWWGDTSTLSADAILAQPEEPAERTAVDEAVEFLREMLGSGSRAAREMLANAREAGVATRTLERAKRRAGVEVWKNGQGWVWGLRGTEGYGNLGGLDVQDRQGLGHDDDISDSKSGKAAKTARPPSPTERAKIVHLTDGVQNLLCRYCGEPTDSPIKAFHDSCDARAGQTRAEI